MNNKDLVADLFLRTMSFLILVVCNVYACSFIMFFGFMMSGGSKPFIILMYIYLALSTILLFISLFLKRISLKIKTRLWLWLILGIIIFCIIIEGYRVYDGSLIRSPEHDLEVYEYRPFKENSKVALLDEQSSLKLTKNLPNLDGARAFYPIYAAFAQAVYPEDDYSFYRSAVAYNNTIGSYERLIKHQADIIFVLAPSASQKAEAEKANVKLVLTPIGKEAFVFFVNAKNPVNNLTSQQIKDIYSDKITNWQEVGGNNQTIKAFQRNENSGSQTTFLQFMQGTTIVTPPKEDVLVGMGGIIEQTANYKNYSNSIGFSFLFFTQSMIGNQDIKLLSIDGIYPSIETVQTNQYPLTTPFFAVTLADNDEPNVKVLLNWILSPQGQYLIKKTGYVPIH